MSYKKIAILGITGAGKSTLSRRIAQKTGLPLFHMDSLFWRGKWEEVSEAEYLKAHEDILAHNDHWIIEGWINPKMTNRLAQADLILYLDYNGFRVAVHYFVRWLKHRKVARPELPKDSLERFKWKWFFLTILRNERPDIEETVRSLPDSSKVVRFVSPRTLEQYLKKARF